MTNQQRTTQIEKILDEKLSPTQLEVRDESHLHIGHPGAQSGAGHFAVTITSEIFSGKSSIERHRLIYTALTEMMHTEIHALSIKADTPNM